MARNEVDKEPARKPKPSESKPIDEERRRPGAGFPGPQHQTEGWKPKRGEKK